MSDLDPNFLLPLWRELVRYFSHYRPLVQGEQDLPPVQHPARDRR
jgi:hypothetical protein